VKKVLIIIRDKLGDSLIAAQSVLALRDQYLDVNITLIMRHDYACFLKDEPNIRLISYRHHWQAWLRICLMRLGPTYDALIVLRGFGKKIAQLGKLVRAHRKIHMQGSFPHIFAEYPIEPIKESDTLITRAWQTLRLYVPRLQPINGLYFPSLAAKRKQAPLTFIGICPITDEKRKDLSVTALKYLIHTVQQAHPGWPIRILVRKAEEGRPYHCAVQEEAVEVVAFESTTTLCSLFTHMLHYYGADTGLYHLAAAMDIPATVFFGPTQPHKIVLPDQYTTSVRILGLGAQHCDEKKCQHAVCIELAARNASILSGHISIAATPMSCPMRTLSTQQLVENQTLSSRVRE
jgi:ADP-heptose:LPS heptosyltransferase